MEYLDQQRLGKQRIETVQILEILDRKAYLPVHLHSLIPFDPTSSAWKSHPAVLMWTGHEQWLKLYLACCIGEWCSRGYINNLRVVPYDTDTQPPPSWLGLEAFHQSHRSNLLRKNPTHYRQFWPDEPSDLPYYWPMGVVQETK